MLGIEFLFANRVFGVIVDVQPASTSITRCQCIDAAYSLGGFIILKATNKTLSVCSLTWWDEFQWFISFLLFFFATSQGGSVVMMHGLVEGPIGYFVEHHFGQMASYFLNTQTSQQRPPASCIQGSVLNISIQQQFDASFNFCVVFRWVHGYPCGRICGRFMHGGIKELAAFVPTHHCWWIVKF